ncbi:MAG: nucleotidyl transferase AbiEii/AbiGii toxin family protein [Nitrospinota bacterium]|nr:nucleotidyl transferase AbiEii/AbiGii toxin family protein [Nitrospinota bacterium]
MEIIADVAGKNKVSFFVVGAWARDMILSQGHGLQSTRMTEDLDLGVQVSDWDQYQQLVDGLIATGNFRANDRQGQRINYNDGFPVDIIPFGTLRDKNNDIGWPPDHKIKMNVMGFDEAFDHARWVRFREHPKLDIRIAALAGLTLLKLIAWSTDDPQRKQKDAADLAFIIGKYTDAGNVDRLYDNFPEVLKKYEFDTKLAGAYLLGLDISKTGKPDTLSFLVETLNQETRKDGNFDLIHHMTRNRTDTKEHFEETLNALAALREGISAGISAWRSRP